MAEHCDCLFLTVVCLADLWPLRPRIVFSSRIRCFRHHLQLCHAGCSQTDTAADTVISGITATDDDHMLILDIHIIFIRKIRIQQTLGDTGEKIYSKIDSLCISSCHLDVPRILCAAGQDHTVIILEQLRCFDIFAHIPIGKELYALCLHDLYLAVDDFFFQFHIRNTVHQQSADAILSLIDMYLMSTLVELIGCCKSRRSGTDDGDLFAGTYLWRFRIGITMLVCIFDDSVLVFLGSDSLSIMSAGTCCLAKCRADTACKLREVVGLFQTLICLLPVACIDQIIPLRNEVVQRTSARHTHDRHSRLAKRHSTGHASAALYALFFQRKRGMKFMEVFNSFFRLDRRTCFSFVI